MTDTTLQSSGNEVFDGNALNLKSARTNWNYVRLVSSPPLPGAWKPAETDAVGFNNPLITIDGKIDLTQTHGENETSSNIDFQFLNEFVAASGAAILTDDVLKAGDGGTLFVEPRRWSMTMVANKTPSANVQRTEQPYRIELFVASGTVWYSGTGIIT